MPIIKEKSGEQKFCSHPEHNPPSHICVPNGHTLVHICPLCGCETFINGEFLNWKNAELGFVGVKTNSIDVDEEELKFLLSDLAEMFV